jgi:DNA-binding NarL/FixJ family response regulator
MAIRVVVVDDHPMLLDSLVRVLEAESDIEVVGTATSVDSGIDATHHHHPDVIVLDHGLRASDGGEGSTCLLDAWPEATIIVLTAPNADETAPPLAAEHTLDKTLAIDELAASIRAAASA